MSDILVPSRPLGASAPESPVSAVSWAAVIAGAAVAAATMLALLALGGGIGLGSVSPWSGSGVSATTFGILAAAWLIAIQLFSYGVGGYIAGRLRTQWTGLHTDEVFFRDTAHGFLTWAVAALVGAAVLTSAVGSIVSGTASVASSAIGSAATTAVGGAAAAAGGTAGQGTANANPSSGDITAYFTDMLFRSDKPAPDNAPASAEAGRILSHSLMTGDVTADDKAYLARLIAARTGLSQADAEKRVDQVVGQAKAAAASAADKAKQAADAARKAGVYVSLWTFVSLLVGAFAACYMATVGGRIRDGLPAT
jgi:hypothetical protein